MIHLSNIEELNASNIKDLESLVTTELENRKELWKRVHRKDDINDLAFNNTDKEAKISFEKYISLIASGFLGGKKPVYTINDTLDEKKIQLIKELLDKEIVDKDYKTKMEIIIDYITRFNDDNAEHYDLIRDAIELRSAYELIYENENNEIIYTRLDPLQTVAIWNNKAPFDLIGLVRLYDEMDIKGKTRSIVELTDKKGTRKFLKQGSVYNEKETIANDEDYIELFEEYENHNWGDVPAFAVELDEALFESVVGVIKLYEKLVQNTANMFEYNDEAKLSIYGYSPENPMTKEIQVQNADGTTTIVTEVNEARTIEDELVLKSKTLYFPDKSMGGAEWVEKNINDNAIQNTLKTYIDLILMIAGVPNTFDLGFTNADNASAIDRKFFSLNQMTIEMVHQFEKGYLRRWELIFNRINLKKNTNFDFRDINIDLPLNLPSNESEVIDMWLKLKGLVSDETIIERLPLGLDFTSEMNKMEEQTQRNIETNMIQMQMLGQEMQKNEELNPMQQSLKDNKEEKEEQEKEIKEKNR